MFIIIKICYCNIYKYNHLTIFIYYVIPYTYISLVGVGLYFGSNVASMISLNT